MKRFLALVILAWGLGPGGRALARDPMTRVPPRPPSGDASAPDEPETGGEVMRRVRAQLPARPIRMAGLVRTRRDGKDQDRRLISELRFGEAVPRAEYRLFDAFGEPLTRVEVAWPEGRASFSQWDGDGERLPDPDAGDEVVDTGLTWSDLSLDFLWWPGARLEGSARVKARSCHVVVLPAPPRRETMGDALDHVKVWVDQKAYFILKAELFDREGERIKRIEVDTIKEIRKDVWMVKNLLVRDWRNGVRMGIRFQEVEELEEEEAEREDVVPPSEALEATEEIKVEKGNE